MSYWIRTDDYQLVHKVDEDNFVILDTVFVPDIDDTAKVFRQCIDIREHLDKVNRYFYFHNCSSLDELQGIYGERYKQVFAEYISELMLCSNDNQVFVGSFDDTYEWLDCVLQSNRPVNELKGYRVESKF